MTCKESDIIHEKGNFIVVRSDKRYKLFELMQDQVIMHCSYRHYGHDYKMLPARRDAINECNKLAKDKSHLPLPRVVDYPSCSYYIEPVEEDAKKDKQ